MKSNALANQTRLSAYWSVYLRLIQQIITLIVTLYVARLLGPKDFGVMAIGMAVVVYLNSLTSFGMTSAIVNKENIQDNQINTLFTLNFIFSIILVIFCFCFPKALAALINSPDLEKIIPTLSIIILLSTFYNLPMALLRKEMKFKTHAIVDFLQYFIVAIIMLTLTIYGYGIWSLVYAQVGGYLFSSVILIIFCNWKPKFLLMLSSIKGLVNYSIWDMLRYNLKYFEQYASYFIVSTNINSTALGLYDRASSFAAFPDRIIRVQIMSILFSAFSKLKNDRERLMSAFHKSLVAYTFLVVPIMIGITIASDDFVALVLGDKWVSMIPVMRLLCLAGMYNMITSYFVNFNISSHNYKKQSIVNIFMFGLSVLLCVLGVHYGINGVGYAVFASSLLILIVNLYFTMSSYSIKVKYIASAMLPGVCGGLLMALLMLITKYIINNNLLFVFIIQVLIGVITIVFWALYCPFSLARDLARSTFNDVKQLLFTR
jgi:O-antigen/teichoic acid export membrane protein